MVDRLIRWSSINSFSHNLSGLQEMVHALRHDFSVLDGAATLLPLPPVNSISLQGEQVSCPLGEVLHMRCRQEAPLQILVGGHYDTVYPPSKNPPLPRRVDNDTLEGEGVADMKGGLALLLTLLEALDRAPLGKNIGWELLITPDEEIGSPGSRMLWEEAAAGKQLALLFEPALGDGSLVSARMGSGHLTFVVKGLAAHAGRDFFEGRSAIYALTHLLHLLEPLSSEASGIIFNPGLINGGAAANIVADRAVCHAMIRAWYKADIDATLHRIDAAAQEVAQSRGVLIEVHREMFRPPKVCDEATMELLTGLKGAGRELGMKVEWQKTGGVCDGNSIASLGLPTCDNLGVRGGKTHSSKEFATLSSLSERASLVTHYLLKLASGELNMPSRSRWTS